MTKTQAIDHDNMARLLAFIAVENRTLEFRDLLLCQGLTGASETEVQIALQALIGQGLVAEGTAAARFRDGDTYLRRNVPTYRLNGAQK